MACNLQASSAAARAFRLDHPACTRLLQHMLTNSIVQSRSKSRADQQEVVRSGRSGSTGVGAVHGFFTGGPGL